MSRSRGVLLIVCIGTSILTTLGLVWPGLILWRGATDAVFLVWGRGAISVVHADPASPPELAMNRGLNWLPRTRPWRPKWNWFWKFQYSPTPPFRFVGVPFWLPPFVPAVPLVVDWLFLRIRGRRKRGLCVKCGYDLTGNESGVCPECGTKTEKPPVQRDPS